jgi:hypothetical protein
MGKLIRNANVLARVLRVSEVSHNVMSNIGSIDRKAIPHCSIMRGPIDTLSRLIVEVRQPQNRPV